MTTDTATMVAGAGLRPAPTLTRALPLTTVLVIITALWYLVAIGLNAPQVREQLDRAVRPGPRRT